MIIYVKKAHIKSLYLDIKIVYFEEIDDILGTQTMKLLPVNII